MNTVVNELKPDFWYGIPHGYVQLNLYPSAGYVDELARQIRSLPEDIRDRADQVFRMYAIVVSQMQSHRVQGCALGMHPDDDGASSLSVLTVSSVELPGVNPKAVLAKLMEGADAGLDGRVHPVQLPSGAGFLVDTVRTATVPGAPSNAGEGAAGDRVWQGTVALPDVENSIVIVVQLVTPTVKLADDYRNVLLGVARTVSFTDPEASDGSAEPAESSAVATMRDDFG